MQPDFRAAFASDSPPLPLETDPHAAWREAFEKYPSTPERRGARAHDSLIGIKDARATRGVR